MTDQFVQIICNSVKNQAILFGKTPPHRENSIVKIPLKQSVMITNIIFIFRAIIFVPNLLFSDPNMTKYIVGESVFPSLLSSRYFRDQKHIPLLGILVAVLKASR